MAVTGGVGAAGSGLGPAVTVGMTGVGAKTTISGVGNSVAFSAPQAERKNRLANAMAVAKPATLVA